MSRLPRHLPALVLLASLVGAAAWAQSDERARTLDQQIDRIFKNSEYALPRFCPARWLADGTAYTIVERTQEPAKGWDIVRYDAATGARSILIAASQLAPGGNALTIDDYVWSDDGSKLLIFTNTQKVWRQNTRGDYWVLDLKSGGVKKLGGSAPASSLMFA